MLKRVDHIILSIGSDMCTKLSEFPSPRELAY